MSPGLVVIIVVIFAVLLAFTIIWGIRAHRQRIFAGREDFIGKTAGQQYQRQAGLKPERR